MHLRTRKVVIIGAGHVGTHCAWALLMQGLANRITLVDIDQKKAFANALDLSDSLDYIPFRSSVESGGFSACADADIAVLAAGVPRLPGQTRLDVMEGSMREMRSIAPEIRRSGFEGILICISNPCDIVADFMRREVGLPAGRVFGTGTALDSARLRGILSAMAGLDRRSIAAFSMGEHGDSQMIPFSHVALGGRPLLELIAGRPQQYGHIDPAEVLAKTRMVGMDIIEGKGSTEFGIGAVLSDIAKAVLHDERRVIPVSALLEGQYGRTGLHAGVPAVIGKNGVEEVVEIALNPQEAEQFDRSCDVICAHIARIS
jgi:L-lactate dehydrogenase